MVEDIDIIVAEVKRLEKELADNINVLRDMVEAYIYTKRGVSPGDVVTIRGSVQYVVVGLEHMSDYSLVHYRVASPIYTGRKIKKDGKPSKKISYIYDWKG